MMGNCGFGLTWLGLLGLALLVSLLVLTWTAMARLRRPDAGPGPRA